MTNKKHPQPKVKPPKRLYYRLSEAARELTKHFGEEITEDDLVHWGAIRRTSLLVQITGDGGVNWYCLNGAWFYDKKESHYIQCNVISYSYALNDKDLSFFIESGINSMTTFGVLDGFDCCAIEEDGAIKNDRIEFYDCLQVRDSVFINLVGELPPRPSVDGKTVSLVFSGVNITKANLFIRAEEVERIKRGEEPDRLPEEEKNSMANSMRQPRPQKTNSELSVIAALLTNRRADSYRGLENASQLAGCPVGKSTIGEVLKRVKEIAPHCPSLKNE